MAPGLISDQHRRSPHGRRIVTEGGVLLILILIILICSGGEGEL